MNRFLFILLFFFVFTFPHFGQVDQDTIHNSQPVESTEEDKTEEEVVIKKKVVNVLPYLEDKTPDITISKFETDYKKKYKQDSEFDYSEEGNKDSLWKRFKRWFNQRLIDFFRQFDIDYETSSRLQIFYRIAGVLVITLIIYYITRAFIQKDAYWILKKSGKKMEIPIDDIELNLKSVDFPTLLNQTIKEEQYRLSIRYYYLWLLQKLQEQEQIEWHIEKTNSDYQDEIKDSSLKEDFKYLSYIYNNIWYGEFEITESEFNQAKKSFDTILKTKLK